MVGDTVVDHAERQWPPIIHGDIDALQEARRISEKWGGGDLRGGWGVITPSWAAGALKGTASSLSVSARAIDLLASDMAAMEWRATGEPIILTKDSMLLNGRKRLAACVKSDTPFVALLIYGAPLAALDTMNNLRGRRLSDILHIQGEPNYRSLAKALELLWRMRDGGFDTKTPMASDRQLLALLDAHPSIRDSLAFAGHRGRLQRLTSFTVAHFMIRQVDQDRAVAFTRVLVEDGAAVVSGTPGKRAHEGHPARAYNDLILNSRATGGNLDRDKLASLASFILAYNAFARGTPVKTLRWAPTDQSGAEQPFPMIEGWKPEMALTLVKYRSSPSTATSHDNASADAIDIDAGTNDNIMAGFEQHPKSQEIWQKAFPDGVVPSVTLRMIGSRESTVLLDQNTANRTRVTVTVARYQRDIESDDFMSLNGETIKVARSGRMLDGQHRITALENSGKRLPFLVVEGLQEHAFDVMDRAVAKTFADVLRERNLSNAGTLAAATRMQWLYERDGFKVYYGLSPSNPEMNAVLQRNPDLLNSLEYNNRLRGLLIPAVGCWVEYRLKQANPELAATFLSKLASGEDLGKGDPILILRKRLFDMELERQKDRSDIEKVSTKDEGPGGPITVRLAALTILAFNMWTHGRTITQQALRWRGVELEGFPAINIGTPDSAPPKRRRRPPAKKPEEPTS